MSGLTFTRATKERAKLRLALFGPSGAGKTYTALGIASGLGGRVAVIDTERGSASKYADRFEFDVLELPKTDIATYLEGIRAAAGYDALIIDSLSHAWRELLETVDQLARTKYGGNKWSAWSEGTPMQNRLIDALLSFDGHLIATMRTRTEWVIQTDERGKNSPKRIGTSPEQGKGIEYEFDLLMEISPEHTGVVTKDRTGRLQDSVIECPGAELGRELADWLATGIAPAPRASAPAQVEAPEPEPAAHWIDDPRVRARFWKWTSDTLGMTRDEVHEALGVEHVNQFAGTMQDAKETIGEWINERIAEGETEAE